MSGQRRLDKARCGEFSELGLWRAEWHCGIGGQALEGGGSAQGGGQETAKKRRYFLL